MPISHVSIIIAGHEKHEAMHNASITGKIYSSYEVRVS